MDSQESKKQKVEQILDEDIPVGVQSDEESDDGSVYDAPLSDFGGNEKLRSQWLLRRQQLKESDGFHVGPYDGVLIDGCHMMDLHEEGKDSLYLESLNKCALRAIDYWNKDNKGEELKLSKILKAVYASSRGDLFYITLEAENVSTTVKKVYETKVFDDFIYNDLLVNFIRPKKT